MAALPVKRIDTHAAIGISGRRPRALKIKRAVRFPFLDYSTLEKRKAACAAEIEVNRALCAGDLPRRGGDHTRGGRRSRHRRQRRAGRMGGGDAPLRRDADARSSGRRRARSTTPSPTRSGARSQPRTRTAPVGDGRRFRRTRLAKSSRRTTTSLRACPTCSRPQALRALDAARRALHSSACGRCWTRASAPVLCARCHGDLHLGNIVLIDGKPVLFDAIEFDAAIATGDVFYDLAFLLMDLIERGLPGAANIVLNRYLDRDATPARPRRTGRAAAVHVGARGDPRQGHRRAAPARQTHAIELTQRARAYFALAKNCWRRRSRVLVAVGGLSGTGKSLLARALAPALPPLPGAVVLRSDVERKTLYRRRAKPSGCRKPPMRRMSPPGSMQASPKRRGARAPPVIR